MGIIDNGEEKRFRITPSIAVSIPPKKMPKERNITLADIHLPSNAVLHMRKSEMGRSKSDSAPTSTRRRVEKAAPIRAEQDALTQEMLL